MKVLLITEFFPTGKDLRFSGGVEARTFFIAKYLAKGHEVSIIAARTHGTPKIEKISGFTIYRVGPIRNYNASVGHLISRLLFINAAVKFGKTRDVDIVDGGNYISHYIASRISNHTKIPKVAWYPDVWLNSWLKNAGFYGIFGEILERFNMKSNFDAYIAISKETAKKLQKYTAKKINVIYCGIEKREFEEKSNKFKNPTIICVSRLAKYKNIKTVILAFGLLNTKLNKTRLVIIGTGPEEKSLKGQVKAMKLNKKVKFLSNLPRRKLISFYQSSHVFSLPSLVEGFGIATIEAAAAALPYVNSNIPIQKEVTKGSLGGYLVDPLKPREFSQKFLSLLSNQKLYAQKSREVVSLAHSYNWDNIAAQTLEIYKALTKTP